PAVGWHLRRGDLPRVRGYRAGGASRCADRAGGDLRIVTGEHGAETEQVGDGILRRAEAAYVEFFRAMARVCPEGAIAEEDGLVLVATGRALPMLNFAVLTRPPADPAVALARAQRFYG